MSSPGEKKPTVNGNVSLANGGGDSAVNKLLQEPQPLPPTDDPELDALLDDALKDFDNPNLLKPKKKQAPQPPKQKNTTELMMDSVWAEEFIKQATAQFEQKMRDHLKSSLQGGSKREQKLLEENMSKIVDAASTAALNTTTDPEALSSQLNEAIRNVAAKATEKKPSAFAAAPKFDVMHYVVYINNAVY